MTRIHFFPDSTVPVAAMTLILGVVCIFPAMADADEMPHGHYTLTGVEVVPIERTRLANGRINDHESDTLTHWIRFDVHTQADLLEGSRDKPFKITNPTVLSKCSMTVDKPVSFNGKTVPAGTNLLNYKKFDGSFFNVSMSPLSPLVINSVRVMRDFTFPPDTYTCNFKWETKDGEVFSDTVEVRIDLARRSADSDVDIGTPATTDPSTEADTSPDGSAPQAMPNPAAIDTAKKHLRAFLRGDAKTLNTTYAKDVHLMPGHEMLKDEYALAKTGARAEGATVVRDKLVAAIAGVIAKTGGFSEETLDKLLKAMTYNPLNIKDGNVVTDSTDPVQTADGKLHFQTEPGDVVLKIAPPEGDFLLLQVRQINGAWMVVAEYID